MNRRSMAAVLTVGVLVAGCGSGEDTTGETEDTAGEASEDGTQDADAESEEGSDSSDDTEESAADGDFCTQIDAVSERLDVTFDGNDLTAVVEQYEETLVSLEGIDGVPDELSGAWNDLLAMFELLIGALEDVDTSDAAAIGEAWAAIEEDLTEASAAAEAASNEIAAYAEDTCGVTLGNDASTTGEAGASGDPCGMLDAAALEIVFTGGAPEPELEDMGQGFAQCTWAEGETEVWLTVMPPLNMDDYLEAGGEELGDSGLGAGAVTYQSSIGLGRVSTGGGTVAFTSDEAGVIIAVRGDAVGDPVATAIELAELVQ